MLILFFLTTVLAQIKPDGVKWQDWHMLQEHGIEQYDAKLFFNLHDLDGNGKWDRNDILNLYGLVHSTIIGDGSGMGSSNIKVTSDLQDDVVNKFFEIFDNNNDQTITIDEFESFHNQGNELPDFGYGSGHHLNFEDEYEEHHWNEYHKDQDPDVLIKHKEDIEHELLHHKQEMEDSHELSNVRDYTKQFLSNIRLNNLCSKYLI
ncbi:unnamed protein product [Candida verbasci]|uniref:EF-hand domain-containing protein n=1 Tax=Candida verbasci TaxID=1227364 RepID=A0A9W4TZQ3_9ASCO|nr:unnamed protein product [Candida verbasci]